MSTIRKAFFDSALVLIGADEYKVINTGKETHVLYNGVDVTDDLDELDRKKIATVMHAAADRVLMVAVKKEME